MHKVGVLGDIDSIMGFKALGLDIFEATTKDDGEKLLKRLSVENYAIIYITEDLASMVQDSIDALSERLLPAVIFIPSATGSTGVGMRNVRKSVEKAVGADILDTLR